MDHLSNLFESSMRGRNKFFCSTFHGTLEQLAQVIMKGFRVLVLKVEAKQSNFPWTLLKTRAPKLRAFKCAQISSNLFLECNSWFLCFLFPSFLCFVELFWYQESIYKSIPKFFFSHYGFQLCIFLSLSINSLLQVPPSLEGVELVEPRLLGKDSEELFSLFTTFHNVHVLTTFVFFKLILSSFVWRCKVLKV